MPVSVSGDFPGGRLRYEQGSPALAGTRPAFRATTELVYEVTKPSDSTITAGYKQEHPGKQEDSS